jgi:enolase
MARTHIVGVRAREVLDSRGNPTVEAEVSTGTIMGRAIAPSGASTGSHEVLELRDGGTRFGGKGVQTAVANVNGPIASRLKGIDVTRQSDIDHAMIELDGTSNKSRLGGNAIVAVSLAAARAGAMVQGVEMHDHLGPGSAVLPVPMMNIINGGKHAGSNLRIQEFMIVPIGATRFSESLRMGAEVYQALRSLLKKEFGVAAINVGDEGGFAPAFSKTTEALETIVKGIEAAGYVPGKDVGLAMDSAATEFYHSIEIEKGRPTEGRAEPPEGHYELDGRLLSDVEIVDYYVDLVGSFPIVSLEDPVHEEAFGTMAELTRKIGSRVQIVGDDIFVTDVKRIRTAVRRKAGNASLIKVNQVGTVTEAMQAAKLSFDSGYGVVVSHRSGETEDTSIADLAVALECGQIKTGAPARSERTAKYNRLLRIEEMLGDKARFPGASLYRR